VATLIADAGIDLRRIQRLLGHEDFGTTDKIYAAHSRGYLSSAVKVVDDFLARREPEKACARTEILEAGSFNDGHEGSLNLAPER
jgi:hypothetical protein